MRQYFSLYRAVSRRKRDREEKRWKRVKMSKQPPPAPTESAIDPCPTFIQNVGRPGTGSLPRTIAPPDHPLDNWYVASGTPENPRVGRKTLRNQPNQVQDPIQDQDCSNNDLGLTLTFLYGVKHRKMLIHMISWTVLKNFAQECLMMT